MDTRRTIMKTRRSGIFLHIASLPSPFGIGDLGSGAYRFADFLKESGQTYWQILPLNPTREPCGNSPYDSPSGFAYNTLFISPERMVQEGLLDQSSLEIVAEYPESRIDYGSVCAHKAHISHVAYEEFRTSALSCEFQSFCARNAYWLDDYALFAALTAHYEEQPWTAWPPEIRDREPGALAAVREELRDRIEQEKFLQFVFHRQWTDLKDYCHRRGIYIVGDIPIYVSYNSVDVWTLPHLFQLDGEKRMTRVSGTPPDIFSATGQLWGSPVYRWDAMREEGYAWWKQRIRRTLEMYDYVRIDHFRGFFQYWEVPAGDATAEHGQWVDGPGEEFFRALEQDIPSLPLIVEDPGANPPDIQQTIDHFGFPGMRVLVFAFGEDLPRNPFIPHNYDRNLIVYTSTHDTNTARGWFEQEAAPEDRERLFRYLGREIDADEVSGELVRLAMQSVANTAILPMQDLLGLGAEARINRPATTSGNWRWRLTPEQLASAPKERLREMTEFCRRIG
ncbi:MAG: 4-alpha-glucanotransferase [Methanomicrobiales archaeon]|nr:4-alpha-glucanotransferase [Methanomicrobiales archaeon]